MSDDAYQQWAESRLIWLDDMGRKDSDVMSNERGEYILSEEEDGMRKIYLPKELQMDFEPEQEIEQE